MRLGVIAMLVLVGCGGPRVAQPPPEYPGVLHAPSAYSADFAIDQRVTAVWHEESQSFRAVVEKHGDSLVMVGLGPHGGRAFTLVQQGEEVRFESHMDRELPFPPRYVLLDVHRAWLMGLPGAPLADGEHRGELDGEEIVETWSGGRLMTRTFRRLDGAPAGLASITYEGGLDPRPTEAAPTRVGRENGWFGYRLVIEDLVRRAI